MPFYATMLRRTLAAWQELPNVENPSQIEEKRWEGKCEKVKTVVFIARKSVNMTL